MEGHDAITQPESSRGAPEGRRPTAGTGVSGSAAFVIVLWRESGGASGEPEWRWRVKAVKSGEEAWFRRIADVLAFITARSGGLGPA